MVGLSNHNDIRALPFDWRYNSCGDRPIFIFRYQIRLKTGRYLSFQLLSVFIIEWPSLDGHVPLFEEVLKVFFIDSVVSAGQAERFQPVALYPFQYRALAYLAVNRDVS